MDIVTKAETTISNLIKGKDGRIRLTTTQLRKFLSAVNVLNSKVNLYKIQGDKPGVLTTELANEIKYLKIKLVYQAGREASVKDFVDKAELLSMIDAIQNDTKKYEEFARYIEALVAYRKFAGGDSR